MPTLAEILPVNPEQFPPATDAMPEALRVADFRVVSNRVLHAIVAVNELQNPTPDWRILKKTPTNSERLHMAHLFSSDQRTMIASGVYTNAHVGERIVTAGIYHYGGDGRLEVAEAHGSEHIEESGQISAFYTKGILGAEGNQYHADGKDCEPEMQTLTIRSEGYEGGESHISVEDGVKYVFPIPYAPDYVFFDKPPRGDEAIINLTRQVAEFLEGIVTK